MSGGSLRTVVIDASALVALFTGSPQTVDEIAALIGNAYLSAPAVMPFEVLNTLRRLEARALLDATQARLAVEDLAGMQVDLWPLDAIAPRVWELRKQLSAYDASYAATAEELDALLVTADARLGRAHGLRCELAVVRGA